MGRSPACFPLINALFCLVPMNGSVNIDSICILALTDLIFCQ
ncbi:Uncharacterized protein {ECO:0000313/EMBL:CCF09834.1} [Pantoea ananatis]|nr:hypothetical protein PANA5342_2441 [Pantoea ananatis LMG 5342]CRH29220.1 Uncharacterized protein {ECO:0000313/EMBL:CCF09834.1} [Pantoea ananatis]CRH33672.1 Uncharacterized protein BN1183_AV_01700 [Pantoea ananatis]CRH38189.1 Uncharacterized protein {ECO:0000313/EMBL:CCF09834.1} [Pantoea ananatis]